MINYFFSYTGRKEYVDVVKSLDKDFVAKPSLLFGDGRLDDQFNLYYPGKVIKEKYIYYNLHNIKVETNEDALYYDFLHSSKYLTYKDQLLKMMDRIDHIGSFNRLDRESLIYRLTVFWFNKIRQLKPDLIIFCDTPHTHETFSLYKISKYINIPVYIIKEWSGIPCTCVYSISNKNHEIIKRKKTYNSDQIICKYIKNFLENIKLSDRLNNKNIHTYMENLKLSNSFFGPTINIYLETIRRYKKGYLAKKRIFFRAPNFFFFIIKSFFDNLFYKIFDLLVLRFFTNDPKNIFNFSLIRKKKIIEKRNKILISKYNKSVDINSLDDLKLNQYVYYSLHYEPESSTNPQGGDFYDQYIAITSLRKWLPDNIKIFIKEHPSQFFLKNAYGYLGRSQYFYDALKDIPGVRIISMNLNSTEIIKHSLFVATITGTVAIEAAVLEKKSIVFGQPWFKDLPNVFSWNKSLSYNNLIQPSKSKLEDLELFLVKKYYKYCYPVFLNPSGQYIYHITEDMTYKTNEYLALKDLMFNIFENNKKNLKIT
jgi:hypothetical protein